MSRQTLGVISPGEILFEEFMKPLGISRNRLARDIDVPPGRVSEIVSGKRSITADTALRFSHYFGTSPDLWLGLQMEYDLRRAQRESWSSIKQRVRPLKAA